MVDASDTPRPAPDTDPFGAAPPAGGIRRLPVLEETLDIRRVEVDRGGWRIDKKVTTRVERVDEPLADSRVEIERRPIGRTLDEGEHADTRHEGATLVIPVLEEVLVVVKRQRLVEEVRITRIDGTHRAPQQVELRREAIEIERLEPTPPAHPQP